MSHILALQGVEYRVDTLEVRSRMDTPAVRATLNLGFTESVVMQAIANRLRTAGIVISTTYSMGNDDQYYNITLHHWHSRKFLPGLLNA